MVFGVFFSRRLWLGLVVGVCVWCFWFLVYGSNCLVWFIIHYHQQRTNTKKEKTSKTEREIKKKWRNYLAMPLLAYGPLPTTIRKPKRRNTMIHRIIISCILPCYQLLV